MEFTSQVSVFEDNLWSYHLPVPTAVALHFKEITSDNRVICHLNDQLKIHAAILPKGNDQYYLMCSKALRKELAAEVGDSVHIRMEADNSKYGMELPEELEEAFYADPEGNDFFHALTPGKQRSLIHLVAKLKSGNKRIEKAVIILEHLRKLNGKLDFKQLNQDFKDAQRW